MAVALVGIAGGTGTGKSTIVRALLARLDGCVLDVDSYYRDLGHLTPAERARQNFDEPPSRSRCWSSTSGNSLRAVRC